MPAEPKLNLLLSSIAKLLKEGGRFHSCSAVQGYYSHVIVQVDFKESKGWFLSMTYWRHHLANYNLFSQKNLAYVLIFFLKLYTV